MNKLQRSAIVTGGTRGIGRAITVSLLKAGYFVIALYARNRGAANALQAEAEASGQSLLCVRADLADQSGFQQALEAIRGATSRVDVIVHSAASGVHRETAMLTEKHLTWTYKINVFALQNLLAELLPMMEPGGRIIGLTSIGATRSLPRYAAVGSSKGALEALLRHYAVELAPRGITVNMVCPGLVMTEGIALLPQKMEVEQRATERTPTGQLTTPEDVAEVVLFLVGKAASQVIGQTITVDGGCWLV